MRDLTSEETSAILSWMAKHPEMWCSGADIVAPQIAPETPSIEIYPSHAVTLPDGVHWPERWVKDNVGFFWEKKVEWKPSPLFVVCFRMVRVIGPGETIGPRDEAA